MEHGDNAGHSNQSFAKAKDSASPADLQRDDDADASEDDNSTILNGAKAITGKAVYSANQAARNADQDVAQQEKHKDEQAAEEERELQHLAEWNAQMTNVGGVQMTNDDAQKARQHIIDHADEYAERAVQEGRISADQREEYKLTIHRIKELEDKKGRGTISRAEDQEREDLKHSKVGQATEHDTGESYKQAHSYKADATIESAQDYSKLKSDAATTVYGDAFQSSVQPTAHFNQVAAPSGSADLPKEQIIAPAPQRIAAMGVDL